MTDNITLPRATVQQALEALLLPSIKSQQMLIQRDEAIIALRRVLEQQAEPVSELQKRYLESEKAFQQQAEPIGWLDGNDKLAEFMHRDLKAEHDKRGSATPREFTVPVYIAPPQQAEPVSTHRITSWGHCGVCRHDRIPGEGCARQECPDSHQRKEDK